VGTKNQAHAQINSVNLVSQGFCLGTVSPSVGAWESQGYLENSNLGVPLSKKLCLKNKSPIQEGEVGLEIISESCKSLISIKVVVNESPEWD
jgi:hypothetical protein